MLQQLLAERKPWRVASGSVGRSSPYLGSRGSGGARPVEGSPEPHAVYLQEVLRSGNVIKAVY